MDFDYIRVETEDTYGISRSNFLTKECFLKEKSKGIPFPLPCLALTPALDMVEDTGYTEEVNACDGFLYPDLTTLKTLPWLPDTASVFGDLRTKHNDPCSPFVGISTRALCKQALEKLETLGYSLFAAYEYEFHPFDLKTKKRTL